MKNENFDYFKAHLDELIDKYNERFVVIKDAAVIAVYDSFDEAYSNTIKVEQLGTFLIQQCVSLEADTVHFAGNNVSFSQEAQ